MQLLDGKRISLKHGVGGDGRDFIESNATDHENLDPTVSCSGRFEMDTR